MKIKRIGDMLSVLDEVAMPRGKLKKLDHSLLYGDRHEELSSTYYQSRLAVKGR